MNLLARALMTATALAPMLAAVGLNQWAAGKSWLAWGSWLAVALLLPFVCGAIIVEAQRRLPVEKVVVVSYNSADKEVLAFLIAYLLPILTSKSAGLEGSLVANLFVYGVIFLTVLHGTAFTFNPLLALAGYHFFECETPGKTKVLILTKAETLKTESALRVVRLSAFMYLHVPETTNAA